MFDELFPGMGVLGGMGLPMGAMFSGMQQYRQPGADLFSDLGIMSPQQQMFQSVEMQNMLEQNQLARQHQMLALRSMSQNMGVNAAQAGAGLAGPMLMAMGGLQPSWAGGLTNGINQAINAYANRNNPQGGMIPQGSFDNTGQLDETKILDDSLRASGNDPAKGLALAANTFDQIADATHNPNARMAAARARQKAFELQQSEAASAASTQKNTAQAAESTARAKSLDAELTKPNYLGQFRQGQQVGIGYSQYNPATGQYEIKHTGMGTPIQYMLPQTPGDISKDIGDFRDRLSNTEDAIDRIRQVRQGLSNGAAQGWTADAVKLTNNIQGAIEQFAPGSMLDQDGQKLLGSYKGDFNSWAQKTGVNESLWADLTMALAKTYAKGGRISNQDIERAKDSIGEEYSDPRTVAAILNNVEQRTSGDVDRDYAYLHASAMMPQQRKDLESLYGTFKQRLAPAQNAGTRPPISSFYHQ